MKQSFSQNEYFFGDHSRLGSTLASSWHHPGIILASSWRHPDILMAPDGVLACSRHPDGLMAGVVLNLHHSSEFKFSNGKYKSIRNEIMKEKTKLYSNKILPRGFLKVSWWLTGRMRNLDRFYHISNLHCQIFILRMENSFLSPISFVIAMSFTTSS